MSLRLQFRSQFAKIVDFAVVSDRETAILRQHGLVTRRREIQYRQTPVPQAQATIGVRGGLLRSEFEETAEAMYLTSGYVYESAAAAEKAFTGEMHRRIGKGAADAAI